MAPSEQPNKSEPSEAPQPHAQPVVSAVPSSAKKWWFIGAGVAVLLVAIVGTWWLTKQSASDQNASTTEQSANNTGDEASDVEGLQLDPAKNYGNKYADGLLPVGDEKYVTDGAKKGYIYMCNANFVPDSQAGAQTRGPWFANNNTQWDINKKVAVQGKVNWDQNITLEIKDGKRIVTTNDLPDHHTGVFPVASGDPAYSYDRNPNTIKSQDFTYTLTASPSYGKPQCIGGEVGIMLTGVAIFNGFDAGGRDAGAWEVQDSCDGHPQSAGAYHYHTLSRCITDVSVSTVIGYALDGFPITGPKVGDNNFLTTDDLDECHGIVSAVMLDGKQTKTYHYVMTQDFPYSVSCYRATAVKPPGQAETTGGASQQQTGGQKPPSSPQIPPPPDAPQP